MYKSLDLIFLVSIINAFYGILTLMYVLYNTMSIVSRLADKHINLFINLYSIYHRFHVNNIYCAVVGSVQLIEVVVLYE